MELKIIDLRSDTVTKPTKEMLQSIIDNFEDVGDDVYEEDKVVKELQIRLRVMFNKEDALFFPSGTMCNLTAILCWCNRGSEIILGNKSHIFLFEQAGAAQYGGVSFHPLQNIQDGTLNIQQVQDAIRDDDIHEPNTSLITIENTHNACGGKVLPLSFLDSIYEIGKKNNIPVHMDGARLWNALQETNLHPSKMGVYTDSISVCLSKGLGAPVGSVLLGPKGFIQKAKRVRKSLGGGMRQSGILAAAALVALDDFENDILKIDHEHVKMLARELSLLRGFTPQAVVETNILFIDVCLAEKVVEFMKEQNILISAWAPNLLRVVVHRNITEEDMKKVISAFQMYTMF
jgi:threonine aldolase